jgi:predicted DNA-binding transcriptional regulator AlpA
MNTREYLSAQSVAIRYEVSSATVWRWAQANQLPKPLKINGSTRWKLSELEEWEKQQILNS